VANHSHLLWSYTNNETGKNYLRFNVSVVHSNGTTIFTQQNGTYHANRYIGNDLFVFEHNLTLNFETEYAIGYTVAVMYDSYSGGGKVGITEDYENIHLNDMSNITWDLSLDDVTQT